MVQTMNRDYESGQKSDVEFFTGTEIEHTPAYGKKTLFVVGVKHPLEIAEHLQGCEHIFFGANHSFKPKWNDAAEWKLWEDMITYFLDLGYLCSLDIPLSAVEEFNDGGLNEYDNFIPQIRVPIPYIKLWNYNTMLKIDDKDFKATNPGVWSHSLHTLMDRSAFTDWHCYKEDKVLK
jgi:hypothetical protein